MSKKTTSYYLQRYLFGVMLPSQRIPQTFNNNPLSSRLTLFKIPITTHYETMRNKILSSKRLLFLFRFCQGLEFFETGLVKSKFEKFSFMNCVLEY